MYKVTTLKLFCLFLHSAVPSIDGFQKRKLKAILCVTFSVNTKMAESESQEGNYYNRGKMVENFKTDMEELLEEMEKLTVRATWMAYDCVAIQTNPDLSNAMQHLEDVFLMCKEQMEKKWQEVLLESIDVFLHLPSEDFFLNQAYGFHFTTH
ncbi:synaptonemal complex central element protein 3 isoform X2 [Passer domesticus]|uniref:synaptonemal complex central element protein 3 isoform X2 n=1 Tax=Passer domesticus TaxID=48849 RepID=UPI0030FE0F8E